jgi:hypothetical protein
MDGKLVWQTRTLARTYISVARKGWNRRWCHTSSLCFPQWLNFTWSVWTLSSITLLLEIPTTVSPPCNVFLYHNYSCCLKRGLTKVFIGRCYWSEVEARGSSRHWRASGAEVRRPLRQHPRRCRTSFPLCKILWWVRECCCCCNKKIQQLQLPAEVGMYLLRCGYLFVVLLFFLA